mgnify:FL=1
MKVSTQTGFTLTELTVVLLVVAILATIAVPSFRSLLVTNQLNVAQEDFVQILNKARGLAMARSTIATVSINGNTATLTLADSSLTSTATASSQLSLNGNVDYVFSPTGLATITSGLGLTSTVLSAPGIAEIPPRTIYVSATGVVHVSR